MENTALCSYMEYTADCISVLKLRACTHTILKMFCLMEQVADVGDYDLQSIKVAP